MAMANMSHKFPFWSNDTLANRWQEENSFYDVITSFRESLFTVHNTTTIILLTFYVPVFLVSLVGNILVLLVIAPNRQLQSVTNNFLLNLAIADLLVTIVCIPMTAAQRIYQLWIYGDVLCKCVQYLQGIAVSASTFTITAMSLDRCLAIRHPVAIRRLRTTTFVRILIFCVWTFSLLIMVPLPIIRRTVTEEILPGQSLIFCIEEWPSFAHRRTYDIAILLIVYIIPGIIISTSYILMGKRLWVPDKELNRDLYRYPIQREPICRMHRLTTGRRRLAKLCIAVAVMFALCWLPYYIVTTYLDFRPDLDAADIVHFTLLLGHLHSASNPVLYCFLHKTFRRYLRKFVFCGYRLNPSKMISKVMFSRPFTSHSYRSRSSLHSSFRDSMRGTNIRLTATRVALDRHRGVETRSDGSWHKASFLSGSRSDSHSSSADIERGNRNQLQVPRAGRPLYTASFRSHRRRRSDMEDSFSSS
ncbi:QRFP-like peptide receptor [Haliotis asinina]|uniref:QRFP-like peptide receptor n=1 Tax=Haliotis asinina TaxID=109174 RepID=UPI00353250C0